MGGIVGNLFGGKPDTSAADAQLAEAERLRKEQEKIQKEKEAALREEQATVADARRRQLIGATGAQSLLGGSSYTGYQNTLGG